MKDIGYLFFKISVWLAGQCSDQNLYRVSNVLKFMLYQVIRYRKKVVIQNLIRSFPEKSKEEIQEIAAQSYQNLSDIILETLASYSWTEEKLIERFRFTKTQVLDTFIAKNQRILLVSGHTGNFEIGAVLVHKQLRIPGFANYRPLNGALLDKKVYELRTRFGLTIVPSKEIRSMISGMPYPSMLLFLADQSPTKPEKAYWTKFLHQDTAFVHGPADIAKSYNFPILFLDTRRIKRGYYESEISIITQDPSGLSHQHIIELIAIKLELSIKENPAGWLWSHKRWKWRREGGEILKV